METNSSQRRPWNPWPISIIALFTVALIGFGTFIAFCNRHPADLVTADYYEQELRYQGQIDRVQRAQQRARTASINYDAARQLIRVALPPGHAGMAVTGTVQLYRPAALDQDRQLQLQPDTNGVQTIDAAALAPGLWKVRVSWTANKQEYFLDQKVVVGGKNP